MHSFPSLTLLKPTRCAVALRALMAAAVLVAGALPLTASAQQPAYVEIQQGLTAEQLRATGLDTLNAAQIDALNALLRERQSASVAQAAVSSSPAPAADSRRGDDSRDGRLLGFTDDAITSRLKGTVSEWDVGTVFELENGQQWKVLKGKAKLYKPLQSPEVKVVPGLTGRWFLQIDPDVAKPRVYLIN